jgi:hypothetical protein
MVSVSAKKVYKKISCLCTFNVFFYESSSPGPPPLSMILAVTFFKRFLLIAVNLPLLSKTLVVNLPPMSTMLGGQVVTSVIGASGQTMTTPSECLHLIVKEKKISA